MKIIYDNTLRNNVLNTKMVFTSSKQVLICYFRRFPAKSIENEEAASSTNNPVTLHSRIYLRKKRPF
jgi:hypothetical protein